MTTEFGQAWAAAVAQQKSVFGETVTYATGDGTVSLTAIRTDAREMLVGDVALLVAAGLADWLIVWTELVIGGSVVTPARGHTVTTAAGNVFEVLPRDQDGEVYEREDPDGIWVRVKSKRTGTEGS
jgi:hypothetical protein